MKNLAHCDSFVWEHSIAEAVNATGTYFVTELHSKLIRSKAWSFKFTDKKMASHQRLIISTLSAARLLWPLP